MIILPFEIFQNYDIALFILKKDGYFDQKHIIATVNYMFIINLGI